jgi:hypothetical protein
MIARIALLFCIFVFIACGLGYPVLNRFDPRQAPGLSDVTTYAALVTGAPTPDAGHMRFRVLVPWVARPLYRLARGRFASWDPVMFGLLVADSLFVAGTAVLIVLLGSGRLGSAAVGLVGALLYLVNFAVPNLRLVGLVDAGEGFFLLVLWWTLSERALWALPAIGVLGAMTKESFVPLSVAMTATWWLGRWSTPEEGMGRGSRPWADGAWIVISWVLGVATVTSLQWAITGRFISPLQFGLSLHGGSDYLKHFMASLGDRNLWYIFAWLLPTALPSLKRLPESWLLPIGATCVTAFVLDGYFGGAPGTVGRELFSIAGPALSLSSALFVLRVCS